MLTKVLIWLLFAQLALAVWLQGFSWFEYELLHRMTFDGINQDSLAQWLIIDIQRQRLIYGAASLFSLTMTVFLFWVYRANADAHRLGAREMAFTPGWAVFWFFVPIANLWQSYRVLREIWQSSAQAGNLSTTPNPTILRWWWLIAIMNIIGKSFTIRFQGMSEITEPLGLESTLAPNHAFLAALVIILQAMEIPLCLLSIVVIRKIAAMQSARRGEIPVSAES